MPLGDSSFSHSLEALKELIHSQRTPLGVALTIAKDCKNNLSLSEGDYEDAVRALEKIRNNFDELKPLLNLGQLQIVAANLSDLALACELEGYQIAGQLRHDCKVSIDISLLKIWLRSLYRINLDRTVSFEITEKEFLLSVELGTKSDLFPSQTFLELLRGAFASLGSKLIVCDEFTQLKLKINNYET